MAPDKMDADLNTIIVLLSKSTLVHQQHLIYAKQRFT